jgi:hypothetical protein
MKQIRRRIRRIQVRGQHIDRVEDMLIYREENLRYLGFRVYFQLLFDVVAFACQGYCAGGGVFDDVRLG